MNVKRVTVAAVVTTVLPGASFVAYAATSADKKPSHSARVSAATPTPTPTPTVSAAVQSAVNSEADYVRTSTGQMPSSAVVYTNITRQQAGDVVGASVVPATASDSVVVLVFQGDFSYPERGPGGTATGSIIITLDANTMESTDLGVQVVPANISSLGSGTTVAVTATY